METDARVDLNRASSHEMTVLPGIAIDMARKIVAFREKPGGEIHDWDELLSIHGFPADRLEEIRERACLVPILRGENCKCGHQGRADRRCMEDDMLLELNVIPLGRGRSIGSDIAEVVKIIDASGVDYKLTAEGTILEGDWDRVMNVAKKCHEEMRTKTDRVITIMHADDYEGRVGRLDASVDSIERKLGKQLQH